MIAKRLALSQSEIFSTPRPKKGAAQPPNLGLRFASELTDLLSGVTQQAASAHLPAHDSGLFSSIRSNPCIPQGDA
jgi:hypothetical protein